MTTTSIMVVEDEALLSSQLEIQLSNWGYNVICIVDSGEEAIIKAAEFKPQLIIMDISLAGEMDGIDAATAIQKSQKIPIIYATAYADEKFFKRSRVTEPFGYLIKPIKERELELTIRIALYHSQLESRLSKSEQHLSDAQRIGLLGSWDWNIKENTLDWSDQMFRIYGQKPQSFGADYQAFMQRVHPEDRDHVQMAVDSALANEKHYCCSYRVITMDGEIRRVQAEGEVTFDNKGKPVRMIGTAQDISIVMQTQNDLWHLAHHDPLTDLPNRNLLHDRIQQAISRARRDKNQIAIMLIDLDHFKLINDQYGHDIGDEFLKQISTRLRSSLRDDDTLARLGGDEFVIIANTINSNVDAEVVAQKLLDSVHQPLLLSGADMDPSVSIGVAIYPHHGKDAESLLKAADIAMYESKHQGKNTYSILENGPRIIDIGETSNKRDKAS